MKRYQCIKECMFEMFIFKPGHIYEFVTELGCHGYRTTVGRIIWIASAQMREHFQELLDLNVDDPIDYTDYHTALIPRKGLKLGVAIVIATILTVLALIFLG